MNSQRYNKVGQICIVSSIIIFILAFLGSFTFCKNTYGELNLALASVVWIGSFIFCLLLFAVGEIINLLDGIENNTYKTKSDINEIKKHYLQIESSENNKIKENELTTFQSQNNVLNARQTLYTGETLKIDSENMPIRNGNDTRVSDGMLVCPKCKTEQRNTRTKCWNCDMLFE